MILTLKIQHAHRFGETKLNSKQKKYYQNHGLRIFPYTLFYFRFTKKKTYVFKNYSDIHIHIHTYMYIYIYI